MSADDFNQLEQVCSLLFEDAERRLNAIIELLTWGTASKIEDFLARVASVTPGPETRSLVNTILDQGARISSKFDACVLLLAELLKKTVHSACTPRELRDALGPYVSRSGPPIPICKEDRKTLAQAIGGERVNRCCLQFLLAACVLSFQRLLEAYVEVGTALVGEQRDPLLKAVPATEALLKEAAGGLARVPFGPGAELVLMCTELQEAVQASKSSQFVSSIRASTGIERLFALSSACGGLSEQAEFTAQILRNGAADIEVLTATLKAEVDAALEILRRPADAQPA